MVLLFILPQSLYVIGDYLAVGIRFPLFRYQDSSFGPSSISVIQELQYVFRGTVGGLGSKTAIATYLWVAGLVMLFAAAAMILSWHLLDNPDYARYPGPLIIITGVLFLIWGMVQYGPIFSGPSGYSVPVGVPILWYCGYLFIQAAKAKEE
jgi:hypothetical protein